MNAPPGTVLEPPGDAVTTARVPLDHKTRTALAAKAALAGVALHVLEDDRGAALIVASKWHLTRQMTSSAEVEQFLERLGTTP